jgi:hypothetical protein
MKVARLVCTALALAVVAGWATSSFACDEHKKAKASTTAAKTSKEIKVDAVAATSGGATSSATTGMAACPAHMAAKCTPEMMAACKAHKAKAVAASAGDACCASKATTTAYQASAGTPGQVTAVAAGSGGSCGTGKATAYAAGSGGACGTKSAKTSAMAGGACTGHGMAAMAAVSGHTDCDACTDMVDCSGALDAAGAHRQTVRLKNGIMYVYTADSPRSVSAVQAAVARRVDRMARLASAGDKAHLCAECKSMRGAVASGKLNREVVNIEGGSLTLVTSNDAAVVSKLHALADEKVAVRAKL